MKQSLFVYYNDRRVGTLRQDEHGAMSFEYDSNWLQDPLAIPLSQSLPLRDGIFKKNECLGFFGGILPEELNREVIAKNLGVSSRNDFVLLQHIGGECAGAVSFQLESELPEVREECYKPLDDRD
jgi:serine/threonine-protein kinase HipA